MFKAKNVDITNAPVLKSMILFALPIMLGSLIQVAFNAADLMVVGNMGTGTDVASVGAVNSIVGLLVSSSIGLSAGVNALLARCIGERNDERSQRVVNTAIISSLSLGIIIAALTIALAEPLLKMTNCPENCFDGAVLYLRIYALGIPAIMVYNFAAAIIRTAGDSQRPFIFLVLSGVLNVMLNLVLCLILKEKVAAVAIATAASQLLGAILTVAYLMKSPAPVTFSLKNLSFSFNELKTILRIGLPSAFNTALFAISNLQMHAAINAYGEAATAGNAAATTLEGFVSALYNGLSVSIVPFVGQNVGANKPERVKKSILTACLLGGAIALVLGNGMFLLGDFMLGLYLPGDAAAIAFGKSRMKFIMIPQFVSAVYNSLVSAMQAFGYSFVPMINSIITVLAFRVVWLEFVYPPLIEAYGKNIDYLYLCYTCSWLLTFIAHSIMFSIIYTKYKKGKIKSSL